MDKIIQKKIELRRSISIQKQEISKEEIALRSEEVFSVVEITGVFQRAQKILIYNSLQDEVRTTDFILKWRDSKEFYMPIIENNDLQFKLFHPNVKFTLGKLDIYEPVGDSFTQFNKVDLAIIPGVAFDYNKNRLGRGKGYYDRFLSKHTFPKMGICFDFQLYDSIPVDAYDIKMDFIVSENEFIW